MTFSRLASGKRGEILALSYLKRKGYEIIEKNYKTKSGEIDIIGRDKDYICFIEVRTKKNRRFGTPLDSIDKRKRDHIAKAALAYIKTKGLEDKKCRFDVVSVEKMNLFSVDVKLIKDAFELNPRYTY